MINSLPLSYELDVKKYKSLTLPVLLIMQITQSCAKYCIFDKKVQS